MAIIAQQAVTLADWRSRFGNDSIQSAIIEIMSQDNEMLKEMPWLEGNMPDGHKTVIRTGLPDVYWRQINAGVPQSKSKTAQIRDTCGMLEAWSQIDRDLVNFNDNKAMFRLSESAAFLESMSQEMAKTVIYGNDRSNPAEFLGLAPRFSTLDPSVPSSQNIIDAGGTGSDCTSIWLVGWGDRTVHGIFPKGSRAGLHHEDQGVDRVEDDIGNYFMAYLDHYKWDAGLTVRDWRYVVRIANISMDGLRNGTVDLVELMIRACHQIQSKTGAKLAFYTNRTVSQYLDIQRISAGRFGRQVELGMREFDGEEVMTFRGIPIRQMDVLLDSEEAVTA